MRRFGLLSSLAILALAIVGCGGGGGTGGPSSSLVGTWELRQQSDDGGETFDNVNNNFRFTFNADGTWSDTNGDSGNWSTNGGLLTVSHNNLNDPTEYFIWRLESNATVLRITIADFQGTATEDISLYSKIN